MLFVSTIIMFFAAGCTGLPQPSELFPPPGQMVDVGGYKMHIQSSGSGSPTIVMLSGSADFSLTWALVAPEIAKTHRVCTYDRAGLGWSEESPAPRLMTFEAAELHTLLQNAGILPPYVLVSHSAGGVLARLFANTYPGEVVGMVFVDPGHEEQKTRQDPDVQASMDEAVAPAIARLQAFYEKAASGTISLSDVSGMVDASVPEKERLEYEYIYMTRPAHWKTVISETQSLDESFAQVKAEHITSLGNIPLVVVSSSATMELAATPELSVRADRVLRGLQWEIVGESPQGVHVTAEGTTHFIQHVKPGAVIDAIEQVLDKI